jgi:molybdate transport system substrate-binding protein
VAAEERAGFNGLAAGQPHGKQAVCRRMSMQVFVRVSALVLILGAALTAPSAQPRPAIRVWTTRAIATVVAEVGAQFERAAGYRLEVSSDLSSGFARRLAAGEPVDVVISASSSIDEWITQGRIMAETRTDLARSGIGVEVREGAVRPDVSSVEALKRALLAAKSIAYLRVGSGIHIDKVIDRLGIAEAVRAKVTRPESDIVSELVARGEVELGIVVITQILTTPGVAFVGPLPAEVQSHLTFTAGVSINSSAPEGAKQLIKFLTGAAAKAVMRNQGMEPVGA